MIKMPNLWKPLESIFSRLTNIFHSTRKKQGQTDLEIKGLFWLLLKQRYDKLKALLKEKEEEIMELAQEKNLEEILIPEVGEVLLLPEVLYFEVDNFATVKMNNADFVYVKKGEYNC